MSRTSTLPKRLQPMLATLTDAPFDDPGWVFEDKYDGFRMIAEIRRGKVSLYSRNGKIISRSYIEVAKALEGVKGGRDGRDPAKRVDDLGAPDVAGMDDVIDARQASFRLVPQQAVRV